MSPEHAHSDPASRQEQEIQRTPPEAERMSFRRRLLLTLGSALAVVFLILGVLAWLAGYGWLNYAARSTVQHEAREIAAQIITPTGQMDAERYAWYEPHHRFAEQRIDPYFVQVFDADGRLLHASENIDKLEEGSFPSHLLMRPLTAESSFEPLNTFWVGDRHLYAVVLPIRTDGGALLGYVQVTRDEPGITADLRRLTVFLLIGLGGLLAGLLLLTWGVAGRVLGPLASITQATHTISPSHLHRRFPVSEDADRETAQLAATLNTLLDRLERSFEEMQRFTANAAHELQTPLTVLRGHVDVALRRRRTPESYRDTLHLLGTEIDALSRMVRSLLLLARLDRDDYAPETTTVALSHLVVRAATSFRHQAEAKGLRFEIRVAENVEVDGQYELLQEVVANLIDNAVKYTPEGSISATLTSDEQQATLTVSDTGIGIAPDDLPHITNRFYRADCVPTCDVPGSGLGLSIAQRIVSVHQGRMEWISTPERGTTVRVALPLHPSPERAVAAAASDTRSV